MTVRVPPWIPRLLLAVGAVVVFVWVLLGWLHANSIRAEFLIPRPLQDGYSLGVISNEAGRVVLPRTPQSDREGIWGLETETSYGQVSTIVRITQDTVERGIRMLEGSISQGDGARMDVDAYAGDPLVAHGLGFDTFAIPADIGPHPYWFVDGRRPTWVIFVHGRGIDRRSEALRIIPSLVEQGFPVVSMTYRGDLDATPSESGMRLWGLDEWRDLEAAVTVAKRKGARDVVIIGSGYGASIVSMFLHESNAIDAVRGVVYDSPVLDLEGVVERWSNDRGVPAPVAWLGRGLTRIRFGMDWALLDQLGRTEEFDVPMLLLIGGEDPVTPVAESLAFADGLGDIVRVERFEQGGHADLWNIDSERYERVLSEFLLEVVGPE